MIHVPNSNDLGQYLDRPLYLAEGLGLRQSIQDALAVAYARGFQGCFCDSIEAPDWARRIAQDELAAFRQAMGGNAWRVADAMPAALQGSGKGKRAINHAYLAKVLPYAFVGNQDYGNCTAWCLRSGTSTLLGMALAAGDVKRLDYRHGTALVYAYRGHGGDGMSVGKACQIVTTIGQSEEKDYGGGLDLSTENLDESAGARWGRSGPPQSLVAAVKGDCAQKAWHLSDFDDDVVRDVLYNEGVIPTGSTLTGTSGDPVGNLKSIGGHAQCATMYDDTDEFREWYKQTTGKTLTDYVVGLDQSWGPKWITVRNWPEHLWGPRPEGQWIITGRDFQRLLSNWGQGFAVTGINGFVSRRLPDFGSWQYL